MPRFADQSLIPQEAVHLCALGLLSEGERRFGDLAMDVRRFVSRMLGPSLDILGTSIESLRYQGLIEPVGPRAAPGQSLTGDTTVRITEQGRELFLELMTSRIRTPMTDLSKLVVALKLRFLDRIDRAERRVQLEQLQSASEQELARLQDLRSQHEAPGDLLGEWLAQDIVQTESRIDWYRRHLEAL
ncbi:MAG: hypothetical protein JNK67_22030 [Alphaproteobacteria bacterium]|nr:hypothetical protein [Alphaproteobacteria bacterium]